MAAWHLQHTSIIKGTTVQSKRAKAAFFLTTFADHSMSQILPAALAICFVLCCLQIYELSEDACAACWAIIPILDEEDAAIKLSLIIY
jgi:hypothetical protein